MMNHNVPQLTLPASYASRESDTLAPLHKLERTVSII